MIKQMNPPPPALRDVEVVEKNCLDCGLLSMRTVRYKGKIVKRESFDCECDYKSAS